MRTVYTDVTDLDPSPGVELLERAGLEVEIMPAGSSDREVHEAIEDADAVVCGYRRLPGEVLRRSPRLGLVATLSVGTDMVDVESATPLGIQVCNVPPVASEEVATHALAMLLALERRLMRGQEIVRGGEWDAVAYGAPRRLSELTLGLLGFGRIGRRLASLAAPLFHRIIVCDPYAPDALPAGVHAVEFEQLIRESDVLSLHLPLTPESTSLIDAEVIASMKDGATLINVSRGALLDHEALHRSMLSRKIRHAGLDVTDPEPPGPSFSLLESRDVLITPHVAFASEVTLQEYALAPAREILRWRDGLNPLSPVNAPAPRRAPKKD